MLEVLLFSFSISIDAFGYSMGFGSKNIKINKFDFLLLNLINSLILSIFLISFSYIDYLFNNNFIEKISPVILCLFGCYYIFESFYSLIKLNSLKNNLQIKKSYENKFVRKINNYFGFSDLFILFSIFIFENAFSTFIFYTHMTDAVLFVFSNFIFHYLFFIIGFDLGSKIVKKVNFKSSFLTGYIFLLLGLYNLFFG